MRALAVLLLLMAGPAPRGTAQTVARVTFGPVQDAPVGGTVQVPVDIRGLADARTVELRVAYAPALFAPEGVSSSLGPGELRVLAAGELRPDSLGVYVVVLSHLGPTESTTTLRTRTLFTLQGRRRAAGSMGFRFAGATPAVVTRTLGVQGVEYAAPVETAVREEPVSAGLRLLGVQPNPAQAQAEIVFVSGQTRPGRLVVVDLLGRTVYAASFNATPGRNGIVVATQSLAPGLYLYRLAFEDARGTVLSGSFLRRP